MLSREQQPIAASADSGTEIAQAFQHWERAEPAMRETEFNALYDELRRLAGFYLDQEPFGVALQPVALVNEAYAKLSKNKSLHFENRPQFFGFAGHLMRRILVSRVRGRNTVMGGRGTVAVSLDALSPMADGSGTDQADLIALDDALRRLEVIDVRRANIVELRFFAGLSEEEIAGLMSLSARTIRREWQTAKRWLSGEMAPALAPVGPGLEKGAALKAVRFC